MIVEKKKNSRRLSRHDNGWISWMIRDTDHTKVRSSISQATVRNLMINDTTLPDCQRTLHWKDIVTRRYVSRSTRQTSHLKGRLRSHDDYTCSDPCFWHLLLIVTSHENTTSLTRLINYRCRVRSDVPFFKWYDTKTFSECKQSITQKYYMYDYHTQRKWWFEVTTTDSTSEQRAAVLPSLLKPVYVIQRHQQNPRDGMMIRSMSFIRARATNRADQSRSHPNYVKILVWTS